MEPKLPQLPRIHPIVKVAFGVGALGLLFWKAPVVEAMKAFFWLLLIPLAVLSAVGLISAGSLEWIGSKSEAFFEDLKQKIHLERESLRAAPAPTPVNWEATVAATNAPAPAPVEETKTKEPVHSTVAPAPQPT